MLGSTGIEPTSSADWPIVAFRLPHARARTLA
jgi:hypothetical protein